ncbi:hypothetical protein DL769_000208 [Monosporascus sp. CRB-8-3]|nr:hypothetical protein DL769_000208 [Monosporascus sp. CRB-8-3]
MADNAEFLPGQISPRIPTNHDSEFPPIPLLSPARLPLDILYEISGFLDVADLFRLARASRDLWSMLLFRRAIAEAHWMQAAATFGPHLSRHVSNLHAVIERGRPLPVIETILRAYRAVDPALLHGCPPPGHSHHPPLHLAALRNRFDVVRALLAHGADIDVRESGIWTGCCCRPAAGVQCGTPGCATKNALDVARHAGNVKMAAFLLEHGIEDLGRDCGEKGGVVSWEYRHGDRRLLWDGSKASWDLLWS